MEQILKPGPIQEQWLRELEENNRGRCSSKLGTTRNGIECTCATGLLGLMVGVCKWDRGELLDENGHTGSLSKMATYEVGLFTNMGEPYTKEHPVIESIVHMNDNGTPWPEIAKIVRENFSVYFNRSI